MKSKSLLYIGFQSHCLDIYSLKYRWFGALWRQHESRKKVIRYWFADTKQEAFAHAETLGPTRREDGEVADIYRSFRRQQAKRDWTHHPVKPIGNANKEPWRSKREGWYIIRLQKSFPCYAAAVRVNKLFVWLIHSAVCENESDVERFRKRVMFTHKIKILR
ncbi:MAG: hypothetical protein LKI80_10725 [Sporolactobacillus sp.]|jgi:hypothetical protein|nr:hypothetical protein [Sporolactobacillus sp.]